MTDSEVARYLQENPSFFQHRPELFTQLVLPDPHQGQAVSLVERQAMLLRERVRALDARLAELLRIGRENDLLARRLVEWTKGLLGATGRGPRAAVAADLLQQLFGVPLAEFRFWDAQAPGARAAAAALAAALPAPVCGAALDLRALEDLPDAWSAMRSVALVPLRADEGAAPFGLLALGSPDPARFEASLGTAVLARIGELAGAALAPDNAA